MTSTTAKPSFFKSALTTARQTRRAYIGAHIMAFEFAQKRAASRWEQAKTFGAYLVAKGETVETEVTDAFGAAKDKVLDVLPESTAYKTITVKPTKVVKKAKQVDLSTDITPNAKTSSSKDKTAAQSGKIVKDKYTAHVENAAKYDADVNPIHIKKIVDHLGVALNSRDGKFVACSDAAERETVVKSWLLKKLGVDAEMAALDEKVGAVCETMKADRMKPRVTFYYLLAKNEGKLGEL